MSDETDTQINLVPSTVIDEEPELTTDVDMTQQKKKGPGGIFSKFAKGYKNNTIILMTCNSISLCTLVLPPMFHLCSLTTSFLALVIISLFSFYSIRLMLELIIKTNSISYYQLLYNQVNKKLAYTYEVFNFIYLFLKVCVIQYISFYLILDLVQIFSNNYFTRVNIVKLVILSVLLVVQFPLFFFTFDYYNIGLFSTTLLIIFSVIGIVVEIFTNLDKINNKELVENIAKFNAKKVAYFVGLTIFLFNNHNNFFGFFKEFKLRTKKRGNNVLLSWYLITLTIFVVFGVIGFFFGNIKYNGTIVLIFNAEKEMKTRIYQHVIKIMIIMSVQILLPLTFINAKEEIKALLKSREELKVLQNTGLVIGTLLLSYLIIFFTKDVLTLIGVVGGVVSCFISFVFPAAAYHKVIKGNVFKQMVNTPMMMCFTVLGVIITTLAFCYCYKSPFEK